RRRPDARVRQDELGGRGAPHLARTTRGWPCSDRAVLDRLLDPRDDLIEHLRQRRGRLEAQDLLCLVDARYPLLDVVFESGIAYVAERDVRAFDLRPDELGEIDHV